MSLDQKIRETLRQPPSTTSPAPDPWERFERRLARARHRAAGSLIALVVIGGLLAVVLVPKGKDARGFVGPDATATGSQDTSSTATTYVEPINRFSVDVPSGWIHDSFGGNLIFHPAAVPASAYPPSNTFEVAFLFHGLPSGGVQGLSPSGEPTPSPEPSGRQIGGRNVTGANMTTSDGTYHDNRYGIDWSNVYCEGCSGDLVVSIAGWSGGKDQSGNDIPDYWDHYIKEAEDLVSSIRALPLAEPTHGTIGAGIKRDAAAQLIIAFLEQRLSQGPDRYADRFLSPDVWGGVSSPLYGKKPPERDIVMPYVSYEISSSSPCDEICHTPASTESFMISISTGAPGDTAWNAGGEMLTVGTATNADGVYGMVITEIGAWIS